MLNDRSKLRFIDAATGHVLSPVLLHSLIAHGQQMAYDKHKAFNDSTVSGCLPSVKMSIALKAHITSDYGYDIYHIWRKDAQQWFLKVLTARASCVLAAQRCAWSSIWLTF
jgi:hypothetical protein